MPKQGSFVTMVKVQVQVQGCDCDVFSEAKVKRNVIFQNGTPSKSREKKQD
jgi:uncharacterized protein YjhX (UPF0386 family)